MIIVDRALAERAEAGSPVRIGLVGTGFLGRALIRQLAEAAPGLQVAAVSNRTLSRARAACEEAGFDVEVVDSQKRLDEVAASGGCAVTDDASLIARSEAIEVLVEVTGTVEFAANVVLEAIEHGKHVVLVNAEVDGTVGPALKRYADSAGVILSGADGDQPAAEMNLHRFVRGIGMNPLLCGNVKGLMDHYRTPDTQEGFARKWGQRPYMVTSFADGSKISFEQAVIGNATGMGVATRGMFGYEWQGYLDEKGHVDLYDADMLREAGGIVDYVVGAKPGAGVYVLAEQTREAERHFLDLYKMGEGPLYCFYTPYHLCYFEVPLTVARVALLGDAAIAPDAGMVVDVVATAKRDLKAGETLDGIGYYTAYGQCENADVAEAQGLLPIGVAEGCSLTRDVAKDEVLTYSDVDLPAGRLCDRLREEQRPLIHRRRQPAAA
ncbi:MAG TPA: Gfo/Idh/MocA family oxidoreductase [Gaiellaceae bacterium]|nr:Gfo/Idh/MocA family oxidoreductase [Gaiellaceae bacterium]